MHMHTFASKLYLQHIYSTYIRNIIASCILYNKIHACMYICVGRQNFAADVPGQWVLEAKISSYKLYTKSFLSLLMEKGWISDEVAIVCI